jgi:hypothetical protein
MAQGPKSREELARSLLPSAYMAAAAARFLAFSLTFSLLTAGCSQDPGGTGGTTPGTPRISGPTTPVVGGDAVPSELAQTLTAAAAEDGAALRAGHPVEVSESLGYDATSAAGLELIQASPFTLTPSQLSKLGANGFVIAKNQIVPGFAYGYKSIYAADLPVYVSADSVLFAVHHSFDQILALVETDYLVQELRLMLDDVRTSLPTASIDEKTRRDVDLYLSVAKSLLNGAFAGPVAGGDAAAAQALYEKATAAMGHEATSLFGVQRDEDFSQFKPRGHYTDSPLLSQYFRAMMWLGRVDLRIIETLEDGRQVFRRPQFDTALALYEVLGDDGRQRWAHVDDLIGKFVGEHDSATISDVPALLTKLGAGSFEATKALSDQQIIDAIASSGWGGQRIASRIIVNASDTPTLPLDRSFALFGQRYTVDSHVFVNTTYDRVSGRLMPNPLDVAFAALGNDSALTLLTPDLANASYAGGLAKTRALIDAHEAAYWDGSLYTQWLAALRTLAPKAGDRETLPSVALMPAFRERILNTQLASWAELRHDTILYAKQSYTSGAVCEFPDAYVDPYPEFYGKLGELAARMQEVASALPSNPAAAPLESWAKNFVMVSGYLKQMAENQRSGTPHGAELLAFINEAVRWDEQLICGGKQFTNLSGWYMKLFFNPLSAIEFDPTIADVHTQPTDEAGNDVGRVLHVGTGYVRTMVVTVNTCSGPRAYAGLASSYSELIGENWQRFTDSEWARQLKSGFFADVPWMSRALSE